MDKLKIGWAETDITPEGTVDVCGQYYARESSEIHSRLGATVMASESGGEQAIMISLDLVSFSADFLDELRENIKGKCPELDVSKIIMNATHSHSAPAVDVRRDNEKRANDVEKYKDLVISRISEAVVNAWKARKPAGIAATSDCASAGHCRRAVYADGTAEMYGDTSRHDFIGMEGSEDSTVELLFVVDEDAKPTGAIVNVACPSQIMEAAYLISSDFMGEVRLLLKEKFGADFRTLCQVSAAGCQSPRDLIMDIRSRPGAKRRKLLSSSLPVEVQVISQRQERSNLAVMAD